MYNHPLQLLELEKPGSGHNQQLSELQSRSNDLESSSQRKDQEINDLTRKLEELRPYHVESQRLADTLQVR